MGGAEGKEPHPSRSAPRRRPTSSRPREPSELAERLDEAIVSRDLDAIRGLISLGADPTYLTGSSSNRSTPLHTACNRAVEPALLEALLAAKSVNVNATDKFSRTPLHTLLRGPSHNLVREARRKLIPQIVACVRLLVRAGADVNARTARGETPFHFGAELGVAVVEELISLGAKIDATTNDGCTAISFAYRGIEIDVVRLLVTKGIPMAGKIRSATDLTVAEFHLLERAMSWPHLLDVLIDCGADLSELTGFTLDGRTKLFTQHISPEIMRRLIRLGVPLDARLYQDGTTALNVHMMSEERLRVLLDAGANVNTRDVYGSTVLHYAATMYVDEAMHTPLLDLLLGAGADVSLKNNARRTPKELAMQSGRTWIVDRLSLAKIP